MRLTWRDAVATVLTGLVVAGYAAFLAGEDVPLVASARGLAGAVLVVGMVACAVGGANAYEPGNRGWSKTATGIAGFLGAVAVFAAIITLITANAAALAVLVGAVVALWTIATLRHAFAPRSTPVDAPDLQHTAPRRHPVGRG